jgi:transcriptional regulator with XRE-family HTH domain
MARRAANKLDQRIGRELRAWRELRGVSQTALGAAKGVRLNAGQIQKFEYGTNRIAVSRLLPMLRALGVSPVDFFASSSDW